MYCRVDSIDTKIFGSVCCDIIDYDRSVDFLLFEKKYLNEYNPYYVMCKLESINLEHIHKLETYGFQFMEFQLKYSNIPCNYDDYLYKTDYFYSDATEKDMNDIIDIANNTFKNDRIRVDKELCSMYDFDIASYRYEKYLYNSLKEVNQNICKIYNKINNEIIGFFSYKKNNNDILFLLGGGLQIGIKAKV